MKKYTMDDFISGKIIVRVDTKKEAETFLKMCEKRGLKWNGGDKATAFCPLQKSFYFIYEDGCIAYGFPSFISDCLSDRIELAYVSQIKEDYSIFEYYPFNNCFRLAEAPKQPTRYRITIECNGDTTTAQMEINGKQVKTATAKRNPADKFSWRIGAETAFDRLFEKKVDKPKNSVASFKVGDRVRIINGCYQGTNGKLVGMDKSGRCEMKTHLLIYLDFLTGGYKIIPSPIATTIYVDVADVEKV